MSKWYVLCHECGKRVYLRDRKDFESFTLKELNEHLDREHTEWLAQWKAENTFGMPYVEILEEVPRAN